MDKLINKLCNLQETVKYQKFMSMDQDKLEAVLWHLRECHFIDE